MAIKLEAGQSLVTDCSRLQPLLICTYSDTQLGLESHLGYNSMSIQEQSGNMPATQRHLYMRGVHGRFATQHLSGPLVSPAGRFAILLTTIHTSWRFGKTTAASERIDWDQTPEEQRLRVEPSGGVGLLVCSNSHSVSASQKTEVSGPRCMTSPNIPSSNGASPCWCWRSPCCFQSR